MKYILVTGGAGFIGSNFIHYFLTHNPDINIINLDKLTYAASTKNLAGLPEGRHTLVRGDICDALLLKDIFKARKIDGIINFAAESPTESSIIPPQQFIRTNIEGAFTLLEAARKTWLNGPNEYKEEYKGARFCQVSADSVWGAKSDASLSKESAPYTPDTPYSAGKAAADLLTLSYYKTYGLQTTVAVCSNNYGPFQHDEKFIPTIVRAALYGQSIPVYGNGENVRDWLYARDTAAAVEAVFNSGRAGEIYNITSGTELPNIVMAQKICKILDEIIPTVTGKPYGEQITFTPDPKWHAKRYGADSDKLKYSLNWQPKADFDASLKDTVLFYIDKYKNN